MRNGTNNVSLIAGDHSPKQHLPIVILTQKQKCIIMPAANVGNRATKLKYVDVSRSF